jgi:hypothetical protein
VTGEEEEERDRLVETVGHPKGFASHAEQQQKDESGQPAEEPMLRKLSKQPAKAWAPVHRAHREQHTAAKEVRTRRK